MMTKQGYCRMYTGAMACLGIFPTYTLGQFFMPRSFFAQAQKDIPRAAWAYTQRDIGPTAAVASGTKCTNTGGATTLKSCASA